MDEEYPKRPESHVSGDAAVVTVKRELPRTWAFREQLGQKDYGIDLEIEIASSDVRGKIFKAQVKGHSKLSWRSDGYYRQGVRPQTLNYWRALPVPVAIFVVDHEEEAAYWMLVRSAQGDDEVLIPRSNRVLTTAVALAEKVGDWLMRRGTQAALLNVPVFVGRWEAGLRRVNRDCFLPVNDAHYVDALWLYRQVELLRQAVGLPYADLPPWELWVARSRVTFGDGENFYWGTYAELFAYLTPFVEEALDLAAKRFEAEEITTENAPLKSWVEERAQRNVRYGVWSPLENEPKAFWDAMDESLKTRGALRYRAGVAKEHRERAGSETPKKRRG